MFGRKGAEGTDHDTADNSAGEPNIAPRADLSTPRASSPLTRRAVAGGKSSPAKERMLTVGSGLSLSGEITSCDVLVVEGKVEAKLSEGKLLEITESGQFRGNVEIENADIAGRYDGQLIVHGRLTVRATGRISGMIKYGELEVSAGGQIIGELQITGANVQEQRGPGFKSAAKFTSAIEDDEQDKSAERKTA